MPLGQQLPESSALVEHQYHITQTRVVFSPRRELTLYVQREHLPHYDQLPGLHFRTHRLVRVGQYRFLLRS